MPSDWHSKSLGDLLALQRGFAVPSQDRRSGPIPIMGSAGITGFHDKATTKGPGVVIGRSGVGSMGVTSFIDRDFWALNTTLFVTDFKGNDARFIYYLLSSINFRHLDSGSAQASLNRNLVYPVRVVVPPTLDEQKRIAGFLATVESRIDLLRQTNATLESIAQALFKSWFIDFDPVRAKAEGREPEGMDEATAALFPAEFEESALGVIPKGWTAGSVGDLLMLQRGFDLPAAQRTDGPFTVFAASGPHGSHHEAMVSGPGVTTGRSGVIGRVFFSHEDFWPLNTSLWVKEFKRATPAYAFQYLQTMDLKRLNAGSAVPTLNRNHVHAQPAIVPPAGLVERYTDMAMSLLHRVRVNDQHAQRLSELRDTLLPRLISGKLRLPEAQAMMESTP